MNITGFCPLIITPKAEEVIALFEALGFERRHKKTGINDKDITSVSMKNADGFRVNITQVDQLPRDMMTISMNVDNFEEAYELLSARGFTNAQGGRVTDTGSSKATMMVSPSGYSISISEHIKD